MLEGLGDQEHPSAATVEGHALGRGASDQLRPLSGPDRRCAGSEDDAFLVVDVELEVDTRWDARGGTLLVGSNYTDT